MSQVTSKGCSRLYIISVLYRALTYVRNKQIQNCSVAFPFDHDVISEWLMLAQDDCSDRNLQIQLGGIDFHSDDPKTFWTSPSHFFTWYEYCTIKRLYDIILYFSKVEK